MLKPVPFAHSATVIVAIFYVICLAVSYVAPDFLLLIFRSWVHSISLDTVKIVEPVSLGLALFGLVSICLVTWITTYALIALYNRWAK